MADINLLQNTSQQIRPELSPVRHTEVKADLKQQDNGSEENRERQLKDVVSVSEDGDTVQAGLIARLRLGDDRQGRVIPLGRDEGSENAIQDKPVEPNLPDTTVRNIETASTGNADTTASNTESQENRELNTEKPELKLNPETGMMERVDPEEQKDPAKAKRDEDKREEAAEEAEVKRAEMTGFVGYSDTELEQLYLKGEISKQNYDREMQDRQEQESSTTQDVGAVSRDLGAMNLRQQEAERLSVEMNEAFSADANNTVSPRDRLQAIQAAEQFGVEDGVKGLNAVTTS